MWKITIILFLLPSQVEMNEITNFFDNSTTQWFDLDTEKRILQFVPFVGIVVVLLVVLSCIMCYLHLFNQRLNVYALKGQGQSDNQVPTTQGQAEIQTIS